ncbi:helix-turn-helix domain-containing protein [Streptomyces sp. NPDC002092]
MPQPKNLDPASMKEFYGAELRRRREDAGLSQSGLGDLLFCSGSYVGQMEMATRSPQLDMSEQIDTILKTGGFFKRLCEAILKAAKVTFAEYFAVAAEMEQRALTICEFDGTGISGLLQTPEYTRALVRANRPRVAPEEVERRVTLRQERARALLKDPADPDLWFIIHEAALHVVARGNQAMREQLEHIAEVARSDQAVIQVMPYSAGLNPLLYATTTFMTFADEPPVVYTEGAYSGQLIEDPALVANYAKSYDLARATALSPEASLAFVEGLLTKDCSS